MFVRQKKRPQHTPEAMCIAVQIVSSEREGNVVKQRVLHHVGVARDAAQLASLCEMGEAIKVVLERDATGNLYAVAPALPTPAPRRQVAVDRLRHERSVVTGVHEVFGPFYHALGLDQVLPRARYWVSHRTLFETVMGRLGQPLSKRATATYVATELGSPLALHAIYRMMDQLNDARIERMQRQVEAASRALHDAPARLVFFDCTTLYFESVRDDLPKAATRPADDPVHDTATAGPNEAAAADPETLRKFGYSKDGKAHRVQVVLALAVSADGMPLSYDLYRGNTSEGVTFKAFVTDLQARHPGVEHVMVADAGMLSKNNLAAVDTAQLKYINGARLKTLNATLTQALHAHDWAAAPEAAWQLDDGSRLVVWHSEKRAKRDRHLRERQIAKLRKRLEASSNPKAWLSSPANTSRLLRLEGDAQIVLNEDGVQDLAQWDGLSGVVTNTSLSPTDLRAQYHGLWQIERSFRVTKHDLKVRPMFHWTTRRIHAHVAICYMAFACLRHVERRLQAMNTPLSPKRILQAATAIQDHIFWEQGDDRRYAMPAHVPEDAQTLLKALKIRRSSKPRLMP